MHKKNQAGDNSAYTAPRFIKKFRHWAVHRARVERWPERKLKFSNFTCTITAWQWYKVLKVAEMDHFGLIRSIRDDLRNTFLNFGTQTPSWRSYLWSDLVREFQAPCVFRIAEWRVLKPHHQLDGSVIILKAREKNNSGIPNYIGC